MSFSLNTLLDRALRRLKPDYPYMPFDIGTIREAMESLKGGSLTEEEAAKIKPMMIQLWGTGVEPAALGAELWKFGYGRPPVSNEIGGDRR